MALAAVKMQNKTRKQGIKPIQIIFSVGYLKRVWNIVVLLCKVFYDKSR